MAAEDVAVIAILLFVLGTGLFIIGYGGSTIGQTLVTQPVINESSHAIEIYEALEATSHKFDKLFVGLFIGLVLGLIVLSFFVPAHPIFYVAYLFVMLISVVISAIMSNVWEMISTNGKLVSTLVYYPFTNHVLSYLPLYIGIVGFIGITIMFAKPYIMGGENA